MITETTYIYALLDPRTDEIRYVGKADDPKGRLHLHLDATQLRGRTHKNNWIKSLLREGLKPWMVIIEDVDSVKWQDRERYWIKTLRERGCRLTNMTEGGEGQTKGWVPPKSGLDKIRATWATGVPLQKGRETRAERRVERERERRLEFEEGMVRGWAPNRVSTQEPLDVLIEEEWFNQILDALGELKQRELEVLRVRYGSQKSVTLKEVGRRLGYTDGWVLLQEQSALIALAEHLKGVGFPSAEGLKAFQCFFNTSEY